MKELRKQNRISFKNIEEKEFFNSRSLASAVCESCGVNSTLTKGTALSWTIPGHSVCINLKIIIKSTTNQIVSHCHLEPAVLNAT